MQLVQITDANDISNDVHAHIKRGGMEKLEYYDMKLPLFIFVKHLN